MSIMNFRRYARVEVEIPVKFLLAGREEPMEAFLANISEEGASLICAFSLTVATPLVFNIPLPNIAEPVNVKAEVLWSRPATVNGRQGYAHGLLFKRLDVADRDRLHEFISQAMSY